MLARTRRSLRLGKAPHYIEERIMRATMRLQVGDRAPDFALKGVGNTSVTLSELKGKKNVVIAFFPLAWTPV